MPKVTIRPWAATGGGSRQAARNSSGLRTTWSAASTSTRVLRSRCAASTADTATAGPESRPIGSSPNVSLDSALAQLLRNDESKIRVGDNDRTSEQFGIGDATKHLLKRRPFADQPDELLGHAFARHWPQPCSSAAAHDHRDNGKCHCGHPWLATNFKRSRRKTSSRPALTKVNRSQPPNLDI